MRWVLAVALAVALAGCAPEQMRCDELFEDRIGHDVNDNRFWNELQNCARDERLPDGYNDPELYR